MQSDMLVANSSLSEANLFGPTLVAVSVCGSVLNHGDFDTAVCVLLDIDLGHASGIEVRRRIKVAGNTVPIIYMTGNDSPAVARLPIKPSASPISKPFSVESLRDLLHKASAAGR